MKTPHRFPAGKSVARRTVPIALILTVLSGSAARGADTVIQSGPALVAARMNASFSRQADGRAFVFGGHGPGFISLRTAEVWRPDSGSFSSLTMQFTHDGPAIARLHDGRILLAGGASDLGVPAYATAEVFSPEDESFSVTGSMVRFRSGAGAATLADGRVLVAGAWYVHNDAHTYAELYAPATGQFSAVGALNTPRAYPLVVPLSGGGALVIGGMTPTGTALDGRVERFSPADGSFQTAQDVLFPGESGWFTYGGNLPVDDLRLADGRFVNQAVRTENGVSRTVLFTVDPATGSITKLPVEPPLPGSPEVSFYSPPIVSRDGREIYLLGQKAGTTPAEHTVARITVATGRLDLPAASGGFSGYSPAYAAMVPLADGRLLIAGGTAGNNFQAVADTALISVGDTPPPAPTTSRLLAGPAPVTGRQSAKAARLSGGRLIFFGGHGRNFVSLSTAEIWDPAGNAFRQRTMHFTHDFPCFTRLADGRFLLAGGAADLGIPQSAKSELYDPASDEFTAIGDMVRFRASGGAAQLAGGKVLIAGGWWIHNDAHTYGELLDLGSGQFTATGPLNTPRGYPVVVALDDGDALVFGGTSPTGASIGGRVERYSAASNTFSAVRDELFEDSTGWTTSEHPRPQSDQRLADGRLLFLAFRPANGVTAYRLFTVDPATGTIAPLPTGPALPDSATGALFFPIVSEDGRSILLPAARTGTSPPAYYVSRVSVAGGILETPAMELPDVPGYLLDGAAHATADGRILVVGGSENPDNFSAVARSTFLIPGSTLPEVTLTARIVTDGAGSSIELSWPAVAENWRLEVRTSIEGEWMPVTAVATTAGDRMSASLPLADGPAQNFFRLRSP